MSGIDNARMIALENAVYALNLRVQKLEGTVASQAQRLAATALATPSMGRLAIQSQKPAAPPVQVTRPSRKPAGNEPAGNGNPAAKNEPSIFYNANARGPLPNEPERVHLMAIQKLKASGTPKAETIRQILEQYPDLCKGQGRGTEEVREIFVSNIVEMQWSEHAPKIV